MTIEIPKEEIEWCAKVLMEDNARLSIDQAVDFAKQILEASVAERYDDMRQKLHAARHWPFVGADYLPGERKVILMGVQPFPSYSATFERDVDRNERMIEKMLGDEDLIADHVREKGRS